MTKDHSKYLVIDGGTVKTEEEGIVTGLGIVFGSETETDQSTQRDFFTAKSFVRKKDEFIVPLYYNHGIGAIRDEIGEATITKSTDGWQASARIDVSDEVGQKVYEAVKARPHGFSTGALTHLVDREEKSNGANFLKKWVVGEISLTERPAERKAVVQSVKSLDGEAVYADANLSESVTVAFYSTDGESKWEVNSGEPMPEWVKDTNTVKSIETKYASASTSYELMVSNDETGDMTSIEVHKWGTAAEVIAQLQNIINEAAMAVKAQEAPVEESLDARVEAIVKSLLAKAPVPAQTDESTDDIVETQKALDDREKEFTDLKSQLSESEDALKAAQEKIGHLTIIAEAKETITKYKGTK